MLGYAHQGKGAVKTARLALFLFIETPGGRAQAEIPAEKNGRLQPDEANRRFRKETG